MLHLGLEVKLSVYLIGPQNWLCTSVKATKSWTTEAGFLLILKAISLMAVVVMPSF